MSHMEVKVHRDGKRLQIGLRDVFSRIESRGLMMTLDEAENLRQELGKALGER